MLHELQRCKTIPDLSKVLDLPAKFVTHNLYVIKDENKYRKICLSKKNGGTRNIHAPIDRLKEIQRCLSSVLYSCQEELDRRHGPRRSYGFERGRGIVANARIHKNKRWVFNIDLADFFPSINFGRVMAFFQKNRDFALDPTIARVIAQIACHERALPQGSPCSPVIANLICGSLDYRLARFASKFKCDFSRYADDITFSTNLPEFPSDVATPDMSPQGWKEGKRLGEIVVASGFKINPSKTRMSTRGQQQVVTGLVVNKIVNFKRKNYKKTRASVHAMINGNPVEVPRFCTPYARNCEGAADPSDALRAIEGQIGFYHAISDLNDHRSEKTKFYHPTAVSKTYSDVLFYKYFATGGKPLILTEGRSDILYLRAAMKASKNSIPGVVEVLPGAENRFLLDFYKFPKRAERLIGISGGSGNLNVFLERYKDFLSRASPTILNRKLIMVLDNDDGLDCMKTAFRQHFKTDIRIENDVSFIIFYPMNAVVKTPHIAGRMKSSIEDFLDEAAILQKLNGKTFSRNSDVDASTQFGKIALSTHIYDNYELYDFSGINTILGRISEAVMALSD